MGGDFTRISKEYEQISSVQKAGADILLDLLKIHGNEDVLDLGCGPGNLTRKIRALTAGRVHGIDPSEGMIREAAANGHSITFERKSAEALDSGPEFDVIFCNSAFMWFTDPVKSLANMKRALRPGGRAGMQAPATQEYGPNFIRAMRRVALDPRTRDTWAAFKSPWFFLETAEEYAQLFERAGFTVRWAALQTVITKHTPEEAFGVYLSGAAAAYLNEQYYEKPFSPGYKEAVGEIVQKSLASEAAPDGMVQLAFNRIFIIATV